MTEPAQSLDSVHHVQGCKEDTSTAFYSCKFARLCEAVHQVATPLTRGVTTPTEIWPGPSSIMLAFKNPSGPTASLLYGCPALEGILHATPKLAL